MNDWLKQYSPEDLRMSAGMMQQLAGVRMVEFTDGKQRGIRAAEVHTGTGFRFTVLLDRGMDIWSAEHSGRSLAWINPSLGGPELYEPEGNRWGRTFGGGLMITCGLTHFGQPEVDEGQEVGLHGRITNTHGEKAYAVEEWRGGDYVLEVHGQVREMALNGENLLLIRKISTKMGSDTLVIEDTVRNEGYRLSPHMILYHVNFGFPTISRDSQLLVDDEWVKPRDEPAARGLDNHTRFTEDLSPDFAEQVFFHNPRPGRDGLVRAAIVNNRLGFGAFVRYRAAELPALGQWKMMARRDFVCALEPANYWETPRHVLREEGRLKFMAPGEEISYRVEIGALPDAAAVEAFRKEMGV